MNEFNFDDNSEIGTSISKLKNTKTKKNDNYELYNLGYLILSDTKHYIAAFLTSSERRRLENEGRNSQETLNELQNSA